MPKLTPQVRDRFIKFRITPSEGQQITDLAAGVGMPVSEFIRKACIGGKIEISQISQIVKHSETAYELRRIGAMLKSLYPKESNWTSAEKRRWWDAMQTLLGVAAEIERKDAR